MNYTAIQREREAFKGSKEKDFSEGEDKAKNIQI
jgi:hypothetical protein